MHIIKSTFRIRNGYGSFTIPKSLLKDLIWNHGDLVEFCGLDNYIIMQRVHTKEELKKSKNACGINYNKEWCKKIAKVGGNKKTNRTLGIKTFPRPLMSTFNLKHNQKLYILPITKTYLNRLINSLEVNETVIIGFDEKKLEKLEETSEDFPGALKNKAKFETDYIRRMRELSKKHSEETRQFSKGLKEIMKIRNRLLGLDAEIKGIRKFLKKLKLSRWKDREKIFKERTEYLGSLEGERKELQKRYDNYMNHFSKKKTKRRNN